MLKILGQSKPAATTLVDIYTVPAEKQCQTSSIMAANQDPANEAKIRVSFAPGGAPDDPAQYVIYDKQIGPDDNYVSTLFGSATAGDVIRVYSDTGSVSFSVFGDENNLPQP